MASAAVDSGGSVDLGKVREARQRLVEHGKPNNNTLSSDESESIRHAFAKDSLEIASNRRSAGSDNQEAVVPESVERSYQTPGSSPHRKKVSRLSASRSLPAVEVEEMAHLDAVLRPSHSFNGFEDFENGGDTQPMPSQEVLKSHAASMARLEAVTPQKPRHSLENTLSTYDGPMTIESNDTPPTGKSGQVDFEEHFKNSSPVSSQQLENEFLRDDTQQESQSQIPSKKFPHTPSLAGHKHDRSGALLNSGDTAHKTPGGFTQAFGDLPKPPMLAQSQLFGQTQAYSSPLPGPPPALPRSDDAVFSRPSPNGPHLAISSSSPGNLFSSPAVARVPPRPVSTSRDDPRSSYRTMQESQEERRLKQARRLQLERKGGRFSDSEDDDVDNSQGRRNEVRRMQRAWSDHDLLTGLSAPARPRSRPSSARKERRYDAPIDVEKLYPETPGTDRRKWDRFIDQDDDLAEEEEGEALPPTQKHPENQKEDMEIPDYDEGQHGEEGAEDGGASSPEGSVTQGHGNDDDEYDELGQELRSQSRSDLIHQEAISMKGDPQHNDVSIPRDVSEKKSHTNEQITASQPHRPRISTQVSTVADSQASANPESRAQVHYSSYVPGSQHTGHTSEDQLVKHPQASNQSRIPASQANDESISIDQTWNKIPSSPPLVVQNSTNPDELDEAFDRRLALLEQFQKGRERREDVEDDEVVDREIPESEPQHNVSLLAAATNDQDQSIPLFSTAHTHVSGSARSPTKISAAGSPVRHCDSQQSKPSEPSPRKANGIKLFGEIGAAQSNDSFSNEQSQTQVDINGVFADVLDQDDQYMEAVTSPQQQHQRKRAKLTHASSSMSGPSITESDSGKIHACQMGRQIVQFGTEEDDVDELSLEGSADIARPCRGSGQQPLTNSEALKDSPNKGNRLPTAIRTNVEHTPDSVKQREDAGRAAVSQLVAARSAGPPRIAKPAMYGRSSKRHPTKADDQGLNQFRTGKSRARKAVARKGVQDAKISNGATSPVNVANSGKESNPAPSPNGDDRTRMSSHVTVEAAQVGATATVIANDRVFAIFRGKPAYYYPATWLGQSQDGKTYMIRFDDGTTTQVEWWRVRKLELRLGDVVKVDGADMRKHKWTIVGFGPIATNDGERAMGTDILGHTHVKVQCRTRESTSGTKSTAAEAYEIHEVLVNYLYITQTMWSQFEDREYSPPESKVTRSREETPSSAKASTTSSDTPASRSRRATLTSAKCQGGRTSHLRETSVASLSDVSTDGLFGGMAFAISYVSDDAEKAEVARLIQRNGGTIVENGFEELFDLPILDDPGALTSTIKSPHKDNDEDGVASGLRLKHKYKDLRFAALIADRHSRKAKYMQALALGLPTLSGRWILHSLDISKNPSSGNSAAPLPWHKYLLPAGESAFLGGAIRSRSLESYSADTAQLATLIHTRPNLLSNEGLLMVAPKKNSANWEKRRTYAFLTLALGAGQVKRVQDVQEAKQISLDEPNTWKWIYVDNSFGEAEKVMFGKVAQGGKKRKRQSEVTPGDDVAKMLATDGNVRIVNDEFVIQSLILGALVD